MAYRSQFGDTTFTKVFVGGLAWETPTEEMHQYFEQFGEILEAVIINDKVTGKSKGYGFVTFRDPESARKACENPNPMIDGRRANCNIASLGKPKPSLTRSGRSQEGALPTTATATAPASAPPSAQPAVFYPHYGYPHYSPDFGFHQGAYNPQIQQQYYHRHQQQLYGASSSTSMMGSPYFYGYMQTPRPHHQHGGLPSYYYYATRTPSEGSFSMFPSQQVQDPRLPLDNSSTTDSQTNQQASTMADQKGVVMSESSKT